MDAGSEWVAICECEGAQPVEIETEEDGALPLASVVAHFPGATTLKYRAPGGTAYRGVKMKEAVLVAPSGGWATAALYIAVNPAAEASKRKREEEGEQVHSAPAKVARPLYTEDSDTECRDMILLGMKPATTEAEVRAYFQEELRADLLLCQMKRSKDSMTGYAFVKFADKETEKTLRRQKHVIEGRECTLKIPDSRANQGERGDRKVYVSYHDETLSKDEMRQHFEQFGEVEDVFVPTPWRHFAFVTFASAAVAQSLIGKEHNVRGVSLLMKRGQAPKGKGEERGREEREREGAAEGTGAGDWGAWGRGGPPPMDQWQMYAKMMQESMYGPPRGGGGAPSPSGPPGERGRGVPGGYTWPGQSEYGYGGERGGYGGPTGVNKY